MSSPPRVRSTAQDVAEKNRKDIVAKLARRRIEQEWNKEGRSLDRELRKHVLAEMRQSQAVEASVVAARKILPLTYLFERDIQECRDRMRRAVIDVLKRMQYQAKLLAWKRWRRHIHLLEQEEARKRDEMELLVKQAKSLHTLERLAKRAMQGKPRVYLLHWKDQVDYLAELQREKSALDIQRCYRGFKGRRRATKRAASLDRERQRNSNAVCATAFLHRRATLMKLYKQRQRDRVATCDTAATQIQLIYRKYCAHRHVAFLSTRKAHQLRLEQAAVRIQRTYRRRAAKARAQKARYEREQVESRLRKKIVARSKAALKIERVGRGFIGRNRSHLLQREREYLSRAASKIQKFWRIKHGSYALSMKIAAKREREKREAQARRDRARLTLQCFGRYVLAKQCVKTRKAQLAQEIVRKHLAAERIQIFWWNCQGQYELAQRCNARRKELEFQNKCATQIQRIVRGFVVRRKTHRLRLYSEASIIIQHATRGWLAVRKVNRKREQRRRLVAKMATIIQCLVRSHRAMRRAYTMRRFYGARKIQCMLRSSFARQELARCRSARIAFLKQQALEKKSATCIQRHVRGMQARLKYQELRMNHAAIVVQAVLVRPYLARKQARFTRMNAKRARNRREADLVWKITRRSRAARLIQCRARIILARRKFKALIHAYRSEIASKIQRCVRVYLAKLAMHRARLNRAAYRLQIFWRRILAKRDLEKRFRERRKFLDKQAKCALYIQRVWRSHKGRKRFAELMKREHDRVLKEEYKYERKIKMEKDKRRMERKEARQDRRRTAKTIFEKEAYDFAVRQRKRKREREGFHPPGWAKHFQSLDTLERIIKYDSRQKEIEKAWVKVHCDENDPESEVYYWNEISGWSQWEVPYNIAEAEARNARDDARKAKADALKQAIEAKRTACSASTLLCRQLLPWVSKKATCNQPATLFCHQCNQVFCEECNERLHAKGPSKNHSRYVIEELEDQTVCIGCEKQLANRFCKPCGDAFCDQCWERLHNSPERKKHECENLCRYTKPDLGYGDRWCPYCDLVAATKNCKHCGDIYCDECYAEYHSKGRRVTHAWSPANEYAVWRKMYDVASARYYYFNDFSKESTWEKPAVIQEREDDEDAGLPTSRGLERVQQREAAEEEPNPAAEQIKALENELSLMQDWKAELERQDVEDEIAETFKPFRANNARRNKIFSLVKMKRSLEEETFFEQKAYLERMLRDEASKDIGIDAALNGTELSKNAYTDMLIQQMADARAEIRKDMHRQVVEQLSNEEFTKRVNKATKEFRGSSNAKHLVAECKQAGIKYGPEYTGSEKLEKAAAIEALVMYRFQQELEQKHRLEEQEKYLKDTEKVRKRLARLEADPNAAKKQTKSRFTMLTNRFSSGGSTR